MKHYILPLAVVRIKYYNFSRINFKYLQLAKLIQY